VGRVYGLGGDGAMGGDAGPDGGYHRGTESAILYRRVRVPTTIT
jgi:hypothetical protein